ncbi:MAG: dTDP-4-dehydrorhamnose reductase [Phascolarctobacterium sp.]|nr:dTDP-4-dehydrorhamnose reductase [Phascolarctobacterium sp.]
MKVLVTGAGGMLGYDIIKEFEMRNIDCIGAGRTEFDITDFKASYDFITNHLPDVVIHCSAYTSADKAEEEEALCYSVNAIGTSNIAKICKEIDAKMIYISSDYVFDGTKEGYYEVDDIPNPINVYGKTKYEGEKAVQNILDKYFVVRISWVFGINGNNFVKTMLRLGKNVKEVSVVEDEIGSPTYTVDIATILSKMIYSENYGVYHVTNEGVCSWADFAEAIFDAAQMKVKVNHITAEQWNAKAKRPKNSKLSKKKLVCNDFGKLRHWKEALDAYLNEHI